MESAKLSHPAPLELAGDIAGNWTKFHQRLELYMQATGKDTASEKTRVAILLTVAGSEAIELFNTWTFTAEERIADTGEVKYDAVVANFKGHCDPREERDIRTLCVSFQSSSRK